MAKNIWIIIADSSKVKVVSYQRPIYKTETALHIKVQSDDRMSSQDQKEELSTRYEYRVIQEFDASRDVEPWSTYQESISNDREFEEPSTVALPMSDDPGITALAVKLSNYLSSLNASKKFDQLILVASKEVLATIKAALTTELQELVTMELETELTDIDPETLRANLPANV